MIYFDNASTGFFKPRAVTDAVNTVINHLSVNPTRSGHRLALTGAKIISQARSTIAEFFDGCYEKVIFTKNCTEALNTAILGCVKKGGHVLTTAFEHNSVLRPLSHLKKQGLIDFDVAFPKADESMDITLSRMIKSNTYMIIANAVSNVTGEQLPLNEIGKLAKDRNLLFLVDGAQGGGHVNISMKKMNISFLALAGHKGLYGIMGSGALLLSDKVDLAPLNMGGTGSDSLLLSQPLYYPERLESGTLNLPAIASLLEGVRYVKDHQEHFSYHLLKTTKHLIERLNDVNGIKVYSAPNPVGIVSFEINNLDSVLVADMLNSEFDVAVRGGFHCAPLVHKHLNTVERGLVRVSLAVQNNAREVEFFLNSVQKIAKR